MIVIGPKTQLPLMESAELPVGVASRSRSQAHVLTDALDPV